MLTNIKESILCDHLWPVGLMTGLPAGKILAGEAEMLPKVRYVLGALSELTSNSYSF